MGLRIKIEFHLHVIWNNRDKQDGTAYENTLSDADSKLLKLAEAEIKRLENVRSCSTIENYKTALKSFSQFLRRDISSSELDAELIRGYERWLREKNICPNTISCYMRSLRSLLGKVCGKNVCPYFTAVFTGRTKTDKRAIGQDDVARLRALKLKHGTFLCLVRDLFLFSFYALGMPFVDMAFLRRNQLVDGEIVYYRHKTGQRICVPLEPCMEEIIIRNQRLDSDYVFPLLKSDEPQKAYHQYQQKLNRYNHALKVLAEKAGISQNLTSYVSRHTWATTAYNNNIDLPVISKALGHANPQNTLVYIKDINDSRLSEANHRLVKLIEKASSKFFS